MTHFIFLGRLGGTPHVTRQWSLDTDWRCFFRQQVWRARLSRGLYKSHALSTLATTKSYLSCSKLINYKSLFYKRSILVYDF